MERCWNPDPSKRPSAIELYDTFRLWFLGKCYDQFKIVDQFLLREKTKYDRSDQSNDKNTTYLLPGRIIIYIL